VRAQTRRAYFGIFIFFTKFQAASFRHIEDPKELAEVFRLFFHAVEVSSIELMQKYKFQ
jgi:hypothetical protein